VDEDRTAAKEEARGREARECGDRIRERRIAIERALRECKERASTLRERGEKRGRERERERKREVASVGAPPFFRTRQPHVWQRVCVCVCVCECVCVCMCVFCVCMYTYVR